jgi:hypothetical protein
MFLEWFEAQRSSMPMREKVANSPTNEEKRVMVATLASEWARFLEATLRLLYRWRFANEIRVLNTTWEYQGKLDIDVESTIRETGA